MAQLPELQQVQLDPGQPAWQRAIVTRTPTGRILKDYQVQTSSGAQYTRNRRSIHPAAELNSLEPTTPELSSTPPALSMERSVSPSQAPQLYTVTPRTTST